MPRQRLPLDVQPGTSAAFYAPDLARPTMHRANHTVSQTPTGRFLSALEHRYVVDRTLGEGGMGTVYLARDIRHGRQVAIKLLTPQAAHMLGGLRFHREIRITATLQHPNILPLLDSGTADGVAFYVSPYVEGGSVRTRLASGPIPVDEAVRLALELCDALQYAHARGVVHCDIKPENILLSSGHAILADFGVAQAVTQVGGRVLDGGRWVAGSPAYMSPEQAFGEARLDGRADVYSLACVLYEMLTGEPAFSGPIGSRFKQPLPWRDDASCPLPEALRDPIARALSNAPEDRWATAGDFARALSAAHVAPMPLARMSEQPTVGHLVAAWARRVTVLATLFLVR